MELSENGAHHSRHPLTLEIRQKIPGMPSGPSEPPPPIRSRPPGNLTPPHVYRRNTFKQRERVVIIDPAQTYYISPLLQFQEAKDLHAQQAELAAVTLLQRNPKDFDHPDLLRQLFLKSALQKAQDHRTREAVEFRSKQLHQKPEIAKIDILSTRENEVLATVSGQVIRTGIFQEKAFTEAFNFKLSLRLLRNPNMAANGRFPTAVGDFKYEITN